MRPPPVRPTTGTCSQRLRLRRPKGRQDGSGRCCDVSQGVEGCIEAAAAAAGRA